jgi:hypothetical protein
MLHILSGRRPEKPNFIITRGYTKELWEMTESCWKQDPDERPTVDYVLGTLRRAAEEWKPRGGELSVASPVDDWSLTPLAEGRDSPTVPEHENDPITTTPAPFSFVSPQPPVIKTPVPTPAPPHPYSHSPSSHASDFTERSIAQTEPCGPSEEGKDEVCARQPAKGEGTQTDSRHLEKGSGQRGTATQIHPEERRDQIHVRSSVVSTVGSKPNGGPAGYDSNDPQHLRAHSSGSESHSGRSD